MKHNVEATDTPELLTELLSLVAAHRGAFGQERTYLRGLALVMAELFTFGRHTVTQLLLTIGLIDGDWSSWYRIFSQERVKEAVLAQQMQVETLKHVAADELYVIGTDGTQIPRSSTRMPGTSWLRAVGTAVFMPGIHRSQRFVHGCWFTPVVNGFSRAIPLRFIPAFPEKAVEAAVAPCKEWEAGLAFVGWVRAQLDQAGRTKQEILYLADNSYETAKLWSQLPERVIAALRTAKNRALWAYLPPEARYGRRLYGEKQPAPAAFFGQRCGWQRITLTIRGVERRLRYRIEGPVVCRGAADRPLFLLIVGGQSWHKGQRIKRRAPMAYLLSARLNKQGEWVFPLPPALVLVWLWQRWEMEVAHREMKSNLGVGEKQCWSYHGAILSVQWSVWVYAILVFAGYRAWALAPVSTQRPRWAPQAKRWSFNTLWRAYRAELWAAPPYRAVWTGTGPNWLDREAQIAALWNSITASARA
jgi:hypothetical protein